MNEKFGRMDIGLFAATLLMMGFGLVLVYSSSFALAQQRFGGADFFLVRQALRALVAIVSFTVFINVDYHVWGKLSKYVFIGAVILLAVVLLLPAHFAVNGAKRWVSLGPISFQVSDFGRLALILLLAKGCEDSGNSIQEWRVLVKHLVKIGIVCGLVVLEPDFSTAVVIGIIGMSMLFISGAKFTHLAGLVLSAIPLCIMAVFLTPYRKARMTGFLEMAHRKGDIGYQAYQSLIGLGNGGVFGVGLGKGEQKYFYLPEPHTDFVFSILGEEIGFVGLMIVIAAFAFIIYRGMKIAMRAPDKMGQLLAFGFTFVIGIYVILHACVSSGLIPTTGVPLPFLSYGGVSLIFTMSALGILLNISSQSRCFVEPPVMSAKAKKNRKVQLQSVVAG